MRDKLKETMALSLLTMGIGAATTIQVAMNSALAQESGSQVFSALTNFVTGLFLIIGIILVRNSFITARASYASLRQNSRFFSSSVSLKIDRKQPVELESSVESSNNNNNNNNNNDNDNDNNNDNVNNNNNNNASVNGLKSEGSGVVMMMETDAEGGEGTRSETGGPQRRVYLEGAGIVHSIRYWMKKFGPGWKDSRLSEAPVFAFCGGLCGATLVFIGVVVVPQIGLAVTFTARVCGTLLTSSLFDHFGFLGFAKRRLSLGRAVGIFFVLLGLVISVFFSSGGSGSNSSETSATGVGAVFYGIIALFSGALLPLQSAVNRTLMPYTGHPLMSKKILPFRAALISFLGGVTSLSLAYAISLSASNSTLKWMSPQESYKYFGGCIGAVYVTSAIFLPGRIGVAPFFVFTVTGQTVMSLAMDSTGFLTARRDITAFSYVGVMCVLIGAVLVQTFPRMSSTAATSHR